MNTNEFWRDIKGYEDSYAVSNLGRVLSKERMVKGAPGRMRKNRERVLKAGVGRPGYPVVVLLRGGQGTTRNVHELVAEQFLGPRPDGYHINHIDFDRTNNHVENLEYVTPAANLSHSRQAGRMSVPDTRRGEKNEKSKLSEADVISIRGELASGVTGRLLAEKYGVTPAAISAIKLRKSWAHIPDTNQAKR